MKIVKVLILLLFVYSLCVFSLKININSKCCCKDDEDVAGGNSIVFATNVTGPITIPSWARYMTVTMCGAGGAGGNGLGNNDIFCNDRPTCSTSPRTTGGGGGGGGGECLILTRLAMRSSDTLYVEIGRGGRDPIFDGGDTLLIWNQVTFRAGGGKRGTDSTNNIQYNSNRGGNGGGVNQLPGGRGGYNCVYARDCLRMEECSNGHVPPTEGVITGNGCTGGGGGMGIANIDVSAECFPPDSEHLSPRDGASACGYKGGGQHGEGGGGGASSFPGGGGFGPSQAGWGAGGSHGNPTPGLHGGGGGGGNTGGAGRIGAPGGDGIILITFESL